MANEKRLTALAVKNAGAGRHADGGRSTSTVVEVRLAPVAVPLPSLVRG